MRVAGGLGCCLALLSGSATAQVRGEIDAGVGRAGSWSSAQRVVLEASTVRLEVMGEQRDFGTQGTGMAGFASASWFHGLAGPLRVELNGTAQGQQDLGRDDGIAALGGGRVHLIRAREGLWLGLGLGGNQLGPLRRWEAGAWKSIGSLSLQFQAWQSSNRVGVTGLDTAPTFPDTLTPAPQSGGEQVRSWTDLGLWTHWGGGRTELRLASGMRIGRPDAETDATGDSPRASVSSTWWMAEATYWLVDRLGMVTTVGRLPIDPALATTGEQFLRVGFRLSLHRARPVPRIFAPVRSSSGAFQARQLPGAQVEFLLRAPKARTVELMGDFTGWEPRRMERVKGRWHLRLPVGPGMHRLNVRYDGGPWQAPPDTRMVRDEFEQESGELVI